MTAFEVRAWILRELAPDGSTQREFVLDEHAFEIGRSAAGIACPEDPQMADRHARLVVSADGPVLEDLETGSGVWLRITGSEGRALEHGDQVWMGAQVLVFRQEGGGWKLRHHGPDGRLRASYEVPEGGLLIGRASQLVLDAEDGQLSRRHAQLTLSERELRFFDRGAQNGSYLRLRAPELLGDGAEFRIATRGFRIEERRIEKVERGSDSDVGLDVVDDLTMPIEQAEKPGVDSPSLDPIGEATVLSLPAEDARHEVGSEEETDVGAVERMQSARQTPPSESMQAPAQASRPVGLGARLRRLGRGESDSGEPLPEIPIEPAPGSTSARPALVGASERPYAAATGEPATPVEPTAALAALASERVLLVIDSEDGSISLEVESGKTVLEAVQEAGLPRGRPVDWECRDGRCGVCIVGVVEGADRIDPPDPATGEMKTIQITEQVAPDPKKYRLACLARVRGTVRLRKLT